MMLHIVGDCKGELGMALDISNSNSSSLLDKFKLSASFQKRRKQLERNNSLISEQHGEV